MSCLGCSFWRSNCRNRAILLSFRRHTSATYQDLARVQAADCSFEVDLFDLDLPGIFSHRLDSASGWCLCSVRLQKSNFLEKFEKRLDKAWPSSTEAWGVKDGGPSLWHDWTAPGGARHAKRVTQILRSEPRLTSSPAWHWSFRSMSRVPGATSCRGINSPL